MKWKRLLPLFLSLSLLAGCGRMYVPVAPRTSPAPQPSPGVSAPPVELEAVTPNELVLRLLESERAQHPGENVILSPLSIEMALGMAANGADGTAKEALKTLLGMDAQQLNALLGAYLQKEDKTLFLANSMWFQTSLKDLVDQDFLDTLTEVYAAGEGAFNPGSASDAAAINNWVKEKTHDKIDSIITPDALTEDTLAILINALYFDGKWADPFEDWQVSDGKFHAAGGDVDAKFMSQWLEAYFETDQATGFAKAYEEGYEFIAVLPKAEGSVDLSGLDIDAFLNSETWAYDVDIRLPKFEAEYSASLVNTLTALGLGSLFEDHALDGMLTDEARANWEAHVGDVLHKTYMKMYEEGTEAAAVTAVMVECATAAMPVERQTKQVYLDRPFAFLIRDTGSGQVVFCGVMERV